MSISTRDEDGFVLCHHGRPMTCLECGDEYESELNGPAGGAPVAARLSATENTGASTSPPKLRTWNGLDRTDVIAMLRAECPQRGDQIVLAERIGISPAWLSDILKGHRAPAGRVLEYLKLERVPIYSYVPKAGRP